MKNRRISNRRKDSKKYIRKILLSRATIAFIISCIFLWFGKIPPSIWEVIVLAYIGRTIADKFIQYKYQKEVIN